MKIKYILMLSALLSVSLLGGCTSTQKPGKTALELQSIQKKMFETNKEVAFPAVLSVFQDLGYIVKSADKDTGFITAESATKNTTGVWAAYAVASQISNTQATAFVEQITEGKTSVRLNFIIVNKSSSAYGRESQNDIVIEDAKIYETAFNKIGDAIFIRQAN